MVKAYLRYTQAAAFGVIANHTAAVAQLPPPPGSTPISSTPQIAAATADAVTVWNLRTATPTAHLGNDATRKAGAITSIATTATHVAAGHTDGTLRLWQRPLPSETPFSDVEPQPAHTLSGHRAYVSALSFSPDGEFIASGAADGDIIIWDIRTGVGCFRLQAHTDLVTSLIFFNTNSTSYIVSASKDSYVKVFDVAAQHCVQIIAGHRAEVWDMALDTTIGLLITGSADAHVRAFAFIDQEHAGEKEDHQREHVFIPIGHVDRHSAAQRVVSIALVNVQHVTFALVCAADKTAEVFRIRASDGARQHRKRRIKRARETAAKNVRNLAEDEQWSEEKVETELNLAMNDINDEVEACDYLLSIRHLRFLNRLRSALFLFPSTYIPVSADSQAHQLQMLLQARDNSLQLHSVGFSHRRGKKSSEVKAEGDVTKVLTLDFAGHRSDVRSICLSPDDTSLLSASDGALKLWNAASQKCIRSMKFRGYGLCVHFLGADARIAVVGTKSGALQAFDIGSGSLLADVQDAHVGEIWSLCLNKHIYEADTLITGGADKRVRFWDFESVLLGNKGELKVKRTLETSEEVLCVRVAYGRERAVLLVSMMDSTVRAYYLDTFEPYLSFYGHSLPVMSLDVSSDGLLLATGSADKTVKIWGMDFGDCRRSLRGHSESVLCVAFQPETHYLFTGSRDGTVKYWDADKFEMICNLEGQKGEVWSMTLSEDGEIIATASHDRMVRVWKRTDEALFLQEEQENRMDQMFESALIDEDIKAAQKERQEQTGFMADSTRGEASAAGKRSLETIKGGEGILEALRICEEERERKEEGLEENANPFLLGLCPDAYMLRVLEQIKSADVEESLHILPLHAAMRLLEYCCRLLAIDNRTVRLSVEMVCRVALYLIRLHHDQIASGAASRKLISELQERIEQQMKALRSRMGFNIAALHFWASELADRKDVPMMT